MGVPLNVGMAKEARGPMTFTSFQARAESELHLVTAAFFRSSTKDVVTTGAHERTTIDLGAPSHLTTIGTENGATVLDVGQCDPYGQLFLKGE